MIKRVVGPKLLNFRFVFAAPLAFAPGHFYSPICNQGELRRRYRDPKTTALPKAVPGIDLALGDQVRLWDDCFEKSFARIRDLLQTAPKRYKPGAPSYDTGDATIYACMLLHLQPARLIEIGAGASSALALDVFERFFDRTPEVCFIDPYPELLHSLLKPADLDHVRVVRSPVQDIELDVFRSLERNDVLFIDSTHIVKTGSDVLHEMFEILPRLRAGVVVHFHDIFYPFEYPREWVVERNYSWNELYLIRAFLTGNTDWEILFFNDYFAQVESDRVARAAPELLANPGGGLWLRKR